MVQLSHLDMTAGKTIALTIQTLVGKVMFLLFNMLSSFVIALTNCEIEINKIFVKVGLCELGVGKSILSLVPDTRAIRQSPESLRAGPL